MKKGETGEKSVKARKQKRNMSLEGKGQNIKKKKIVILSKDRKKNEEKERKITWKEKGFSFSE